MGKLVFDANKSHFVLPYDLIPEDLNIFPFHLYILNPKNGKYKRFLDGNVVLDPEKRHELELILQRGGVLTVKMSQKWTLLFYLGIREAHVPDLEKPTKLPIDFADEPLLFSKEEKKSLIDFSDLIQSCKKEVLMMDSIGSNCDYYVRHLCTQILEKVTEHECIIALSYHLAKNHPQMTKEHLMNLMAAVFTYKVGISMLPPPVEASESNFAQFTNYTVYILQEHKIELPDVVTKIIEGLSFEDYSVYSSNNDISFDPINFSRRVIRQSAMIVDYTFGKSDGAAHSLDDAIVSLIENHNTPGLKSCQDPNICNAMKCLLYHSSDKSIAA